MNSVKNTVLPFEIFCAAMPPDLQEAFRPAELTLNLYYNDKP